MSINYYTGTNPILKGVNCDSECIGCHQRGLDLIRPFVPSRVMKRKAFIVKCPKCHLLQAWPMPDAAELSDFYTYQYRRPRTTGFCEPRITNRSSSQAVYISQKLRLLNKQPKSILDIGAGFGQLLSLMQTEFPDAEFYATELDKKCVSSLHDMGVNVKEVLIDDCCSNPFGTQFDLILCSHVIEHSRRPGDLLNTIYTMLNHESSLFLEVPNCGLPYFWGESDFPHLVFFSHESLVNIIENSNLTVQECYAGGPDAAYYISPLIFKRKGFENLTNEFKDFIKRRLSRDAFISSLALLDWFRERRGQNAKLLAIKNNEELIEDKYKEFYYKNNPCGIFLRSFAVKAR